MSGSTGGGRSNSTVRSDTLKAAVPERVSYRRKFRITAQLVA
jgi:hypothetical protein